MGKATIYISVVILISIFSLLTNNSSAQSLNCKDYQIIYMRGSGQNINSSTEFQTLSNNLEQHSISRDNVVEIDKFSDSRGSYDYPAISVLGSPDNLKDGFIATITASKLGAYRDSVNQGKELLIAHLENSNYISCGTRLVFVGYSQGAQVIGEALGDQRLNNFLPQISFVATFGDPTLDTNSILGGNILGDTPWYRGDATKYVSSGLLGVRNPYIPEDLASRAGAWCNSTDMVCTGNLLKLLSEVVNEPHGKYSEKMIPEAAAEIATRLSKDLANPLPLPACGAAKQDVILNIDMSPTVRADKYTFGSDEIIDKKLQDVFASSCHTRIAVHGYWRPEDNREPQPLLDFTDDYSTVRNLLRELYEPTSDNIITASQAREGILSALDMNWRVDAEKVILTVSNVGGTGADWRPNASMQPTQKFLDEDLTRQVVIKSREVGGVELWHAQANRNLKIHTIQGPNSFYYFSTFYGTTGGNMVKSNCPTNRSGCSWLLRSEQLPKISIAPIRGVAGQPTKIDWTDISRGVITADRPSYNWFLECDEVMQSYIGHGQTFYHKFSKPQTCIGSVVTKNDITHCYSCGGMSARTLHTSSVTTFPVIISANEDLPANQTLLPIQNLSKTRHEDHISYQWDAPANADQFDELAYVIRDQDGVVVALTRNPRLHIIDLPQDEPIISIAAASQDATSISIPSTETILSDARTADIQNPAPDMSADLRDALQAFDSTPRVGGVAITKPTTKQIGIAHQPYTIPATLGITEEVSTTPSNATHTHTDVPQTLRLSIVAIPIAILSMLGVGFIGYNAILSLRNWR